MISISTISPELSIQLKYYAANLG